MHGIFRFGSVLATLVHASTTIRGMTIWAAKAAFQENEKGSLQAGKAADFIILDTDLMKCDEGNILQTKVLGTYVDGKKVYKTK